MPMLAVLRMQGRVSGLVWLSRGSRAALDQRETGQALHGVHPLLELIHGGGRIASDEGLAAFGLTAREAAVTRLALGGRGNAAIARELGISESTVKKHMSRVLDKCGVRSRTQLIALLGEPGSG